LGMNPVFLTGATLLLQQSQDASDREVYRQWSAMMLILILLGVIALTGLGFIVAQRRARRRKSELPKPKDAPKIDAWAEAGRRIDTSIVEFKDD